MVALPVILIVPDIDSSSWLPILASVDVVLPRVLTVKVLSPVCVSSLVIVRLPLDTWIAESASLLLASIVLLPFKLISAFEEPTSIPSPVEGAILIFSIVNSATLSPVVLTSILLSVAVLLLCCLIVTSLSSLVLLF
jgi:hypothetical protein